MKEAFKFDEFKPCLDWYTTEHHIINWGDYNYFKLDRRFGPSWWLYGMKLIENPYHWEEKEIGEIRESDLRRFIEWAKTEHGSKIININMICGSFDIFNEVGKLIDNQLVKENEKLKRLNKKAIRGLRGICKECKKYDTCGSRKGSHMYCWEWKYDDHPTEKGGEQE